MLSAVVLNYRDPHLPRTLATLKWCDEVIVMDSKTPLKNFAAKRNAGLKKARGPWVLFIDSDEMVTPELAREILQLIKVTKINGFYLKRQDYFMNHKMRFGETASVRLLRLARKGAGEWVRPVHETWAISGPTATLKHPIIHFPSRSLLAKINAYTDIEAKYRRRSLATIFELIAFPPLKFIYNYFFRLGFLDGLPGLVIALLMSYHSFLVRWKLLLRR